MLERLFEPLRLGPVEIPNRIVSTAHQTTLVADHLPTDDFVAYHEARARGGVGLIVMEATTPHPSGLLTDHQLGGLPAGDRRRVRAVLPQRCNRTGRSCSASCCTAAASRSQARRGRPRSRRRPCRASASGRRRAPCGSDEIDEIVAGFGASARNAADAGLDGVEISAAHRYLVAQFFDPELNLRDDEWAEPSRFLLAVIAAVREAAPGIVRRGSPLRRLAVRRAAIAPVLPDRGRLRVDRARRLADVSRFRRDRPTAADTRERDRGVR